MNIFRTWLQLQVCLFCTVIACSVHAQTAPAWTSIGPTGGSLTTLLADPVAPRSSVYAGTDDNGVFVSSDVGATWQPANVGIAGGPTGQKHIYALVAFGNNIYAATNTGVYWAAAGGKPVWQLLQGPLPPTSTSTIDLMATVNSTLYMAVSGEPTLFSTTAAGANPVWSTATALPTVAGQGASPVTALGSINSSIAVGSTGVVFVLDSNGSWVNSEINTPDQASYLANDTVISVVSTSGKWAFTCTAAGTVFKKDLSLDLASVWVPLAWDPSGQMAAPVSDTCHSLSIARLGPNGQSVLVMATPTGIFVSDWFDEVGEAPASMVPGPKFSQMSVAANAALQLDSAALSPVFFATEFGFYRSDVNGLDSLVEAKGPGTELNGPPKVATPSQRLANVNMHDMAVLGSTLYAFAASDTGSYSDLMSSTDGGAVWKRVGFTSQFVQIGAVRSLVVDKAHGVLYAGTDQGIFAYAQATSTWTAIGNAYDVKALAIGAHALYSGRKISASTEPDSALIIQPLVGDISFTPIEKSPGDHFNVRALVVAGGSVYVGGGASQDPANTDSGPYENAVFYASDFNPATTSTPITWTKVANAPFTDVATLSSLEVAGREVFAGGDGFLKRCLISGGSWGPVTGLPMLNSQSVGISALATDGQTLFVGTAGLGLFGLSLATNTASLVSLSGSGNAGLPSQVVNGLRSIDGILYVASPAGLSSATTSQNVVVVVPASGGGGGCSMATLGTPDPLLWILVVIAIFQVTFERIRRRRLVGQNSEKMHASRERIL